MEKELIASELAVVAQLSENATKEDAEEFFSALDERKDEIKKMAKKHPKYAKRFNAELKAIHDLIAPVDEEDFELVAKMVDERKMNLLNELNFAMAKKTKKSKKGKKDKDAEVKDAEKKDKDAEKKKDAEPAYKQPDLKKYKASLTKFFESLPKDVPNRKSNVLTQVEAVA